MLLLLLLLLPSQAAGLRNAAKPFVMLCGNSDSASVPG